MVEFLFKKNVVHAYPNGWTCTNCGTEFSEKTIDVECLYVVNTSVGTLCLECHNDDLFWSNDTPNHLKSEKVNTSRKDIRKIATQIKNMSVKDIYTLIDILISF